MVYYVEHMYYSIMLYLWINIVKNSAGLTVSQNTTKYQKWAE